MALSAMAGLGTLSMYQVHSASPSGTPTPPLSVLHRASSLPPCCAASSSGHSEAVQIEFTARRRGPSGVQRLGRHRDFRNVTANSVQTRHFNMSFDPSKSNIPQEYNFSQPATELGSSVDDKGAEQPDRVDVALGPYTEFDPTLVHPKDTYWKGPAPSGSFMVGNTYAQRTRLTPLRIPELGATGPRNPLARLFSPFPKEEYYAVEMDLDYGKEWPRFVWEDGKLVFRPGFLQATVDPDVPPYWLHKGIARFQISQGDQMLQTIIGAVYIGAIAALAAALYAFQPALLAAVAVSWARNTLSLAKWALLLGLAAVDRMYLYWVFLVGKLLDGVLAKYAPPVRTFCWANLALWGVYLAVSPSDWSLLPGILA